MPHARTKYSGHGAIVLHGGNSVNIDKQNNDLYTSQQVDDIARKAAQYAVERIISAPNLDSRIEDAVMPSIGGDNMARQRVHITLPDGQQVWITGATYSDLITNALTKYGNYAPPPPAIPQITFKEYTDNIFDVFLKPRWKDSTADTNKFLLDKHILPFFGEETLFNIDTPMIQRFFQTKQHLSKSYTKQMLIIIHEILENAVEDGNISKDPTLSKRITLPEKKTKRKGLETEAFQEIVGAIPSLEPDDALLLALLCFTGMRRGEVIGLKWENVHDDVIHVCSEVTYKSNQPNYHDYAKSKSGIRDIPIPQELKPYLANRGTGFVIGNSDTPCTQSKFDRAWQRIGKKINLHGATPHILRHTYLSMLAASNVDPKTIQAIAGHADFNFTFNHYIHKNSENVIGAAEQLTEHLSKLTQKLTQDKTRNANEINDGSNLSAPVIDTVN